MNTCQKDMKASQDLLIQSCTSKHSEQLTACESTIAAYVNFTLLNKSYRLNRKSSYEKNFANLM